jgi:superfamily II RNA helicase
VPNIDELASWMGAVRNTDFVVVKESHRPVPLKQSLFSAKYGIIGIKGVRKKYKKRLSERKKFLRRKPSARRVVAHVLEQGNFPILYFCFNRRACEANAERHAQLNLLNEEEKEKTREMVDELIRQYRLEGYERLGRMRSLWEAGTGYHHAGILPAAKEIVERLFTEGLIKLLFCTETFALGINMPASSVIFDELEKFDGVDFSYLSTRNYRQMAGRAGRRGMDEVGHVYSQIVPEASNPEELERIFYGKDEKITSRFGASYSTILTLYSQHGKAAFDIFRQSLRNFRRGEFTLTKSYRREEAQIQSRINFLQAAGFLEGTELTPKGRLAAAVNGYEIQSAELYYKRSFDECSPVQLVVVLAAMVTEESRRRSREPASAIKFHFPGEGVIRKLRRLEVRHGVAHPIRELDFSLAPPVYSWANGCSLKELESYGIPEGDLVRLMRMTVQLLRTLRDRLDDPVISERMHEGLLLINRDVVDAQAELEVR